MFRVIDHRHDSRNRSAINRQRFFRRFRAQIRRAVSDSISGRSITDIDRGEDIAIPRRDLAEPQFGLGAGGVRETVYAGNDRFNAGDEVERPLGGEASGRGGAGPGDETEDDFVFRVSREEFLNLFFDDLALPDLVKTELARIPEHRQVRAGFTQTGIPANLNIARSMRGALGRRLALAAPWRARLREAEAELADAAARHEDDSVRALRLEIERLKARIEAIPFIDSFDLRFNNRVRVPRPTTQAVMFCLMDVSGSMDEERKEIAKRFFLLLYLFLQRNYENVDVVFIRHHTVASEVSEDEFFHSRESGGTVVSSALRLMLDIARDRYAGGGWNLYAAQASDGDNWDNDSPICRDLLIESILPLVQYFAYVEIRAGDPQNLWREYLAVAGRSRKFAMQRIADLPDIYPVFRELFRKKPA
ncbi:MAG: YeaH/YhbH family protein [Rhodocyclaceae bacterium]